jgi:hypothetical protein
MQIKISTYLHLHLLQGSPGNVDDFEEWLYNAEELRDSVKTMAVDVGLNKEGGRLIGIAIVDTTMRSFTVSEFPDDERFSNFEACSSSYFNSIPFHSNQLILCDH